MTRSYSPSRDDQPPRVLGAVLAVAVDDEDVLAGRAPDPALYGGAVSLVVGVADDDGAGRRGVRAGIVLRPVVDDDDLVPRPRR